MVGALNPRTLKRSSKEALDKGALHRGVGCHVPASPGSKMSKLEMGLAEDGNIRAEEVTASDDADDENQDHDEDGL